MSSPAPSRAPDPVRPPGVVTTIEGILGVGICGVALLDLASSGPGVDATVGDWSAFSTILATTVVLWTAGTVLLVLAARRWRRSSPTARPGEPPTAGGSGTLGFGSFVPSVLAMVTGFGALLIGLIVRSPLSCTGPGLYLETPPCSLPASVSNDAWVLSVAGAVVLAIGLLLGLAYAVRPTHRSAAVVLAATTIVSLVAVAGLAAVPPWPCPSGCAGPTPLGVVLELGPGEALSNASGLRFEFPLTWTDPNLTIAYSELVPSVVSSPYSVPPERPGASWVLRAGSPTGPALASFNFTSRGWSAGAGTTVRSGDLLTLVCPGANVSGMYLEIGTDAPGMSGSVWSQVPTG